MYGNRLPCFAILPGQRGNFANGMSLQRDDQMPVYSTDPGVIFNTDVRHGGLGTDAINCAYAADGGSRGFDNGCGDYARFCPHDRGIKDGWCDGAPHAPADLTNMLTETVQRRGYNEIVISSAKLEAKLPHAIAAFFYLKNSDAEERARAVSARADFLAAYTPKPLLRMRGVTPDAVPLLVFE